MDSNQICSAQNQNQRHLPYSNMGIVIMKKQSKNLIFYISILYFIGPKMAMYGHDPNEDGSKYLKSTTPYIVKEVRRFSFGRYSSYQ